MALALLAVLAAASCGGGGGGETTTREPAATTTATEPAPPCGEAGTKQVTLRAADRSEFDAALVGDGDVGVVLGHQFRSDFCSWLPYGKRLAGQGMRVLAVNFPATERLNVYMQAGALELRRLGAKRIVLVGASMGGTAALVAAPRVEGLVGVASLSGPRQFQGLDARPAVAKTRVPLLFLVGGDDRTFAKDARALYKAAKSPKKKIVITSGFEHGTDLLQDPKADRALANFLGGL
ncbi:MAG: dienelactone hydrolase family protein [Actinomycetota bacterium]|nr:dienelactone hydrolase family protein [Actinomycetota bacterium]